MSFSTFREFIEYLDKLNYLQTFEGCDWDLEIGTLAELAAEKWGPALMFDNIKGYPPGFRVVANAYASPQRTAIALDQPPNAKPLDVIREFRLKLKNFEAIKPVEVNNSSVMENIWEGDQIDLLAFPTPKWHETDGGRYIGTGCSVITLDPEEGWTNIAIYRVQVHDRNTAGIHMTPSHHGGIMSSKYWAKGESCPIVVAIGAEPRIYVTAAMHIPWGVSEYDLAGWMRNTPVEVIKGKYTGLEIPAHAEIVIEGEVPPPDKESRVEGPFGEFTGYYGGEAGPHTIIKVKRLMFRDKPIIQGDPPLLPPYGEFGLPLTTVPSVWNGLEKTGIPGIQGVYTLKAAGGPQILVVSMKQLYAGHAKQVGMATSSVVAAICRYIVVVDEDIDPSNQNAVIWAIGTRCDPAESIDIQKGFPGSFIDPIRPPDKKEHGETTNSRAIIYACKPYHWLDKFPRTNRASDDLREKIGRKWSDRLNQF